MKSRQLVHKVSLCNHREEIRLIAYEALLKHAQKGNVSDIRALVNKHLKTKASISKIRFLTVLEACHA